MEYSSTRQRTPQVTEMSENTRQLTAKNRSLFTRAVQAETRGREMQEKLNEFGEQLRAVRNECNHRVEASRSLDQLLSEKQEELEQRGGTWSWLGETKKLLVGN